MAVARSESGAAPGSLRADLSLPKTIPKKTNQTPIFPFPLTQVLTLAGPAVMVNTALMGLTAKYILPYGWDWPTALLFGSMIWCVSVLYDRIHLFVCLLAHPFIHMDTQTRIHTHTH